MPRQGSVSFDRAADYYDRTRALPAGRAAAQTALLTAQLAPTSGPCLEIGVGTGRIALPLAAQGVPVVGLDLSLPMLGRLLAKDQARTVPVVVADAMSLPFAADAFAAAVACHVLHLVADWVAVVEELTRVVVPGGTVLATRGAPRDGLMANLARRIRVEAGLPHDPGRLTLDEVDAYMAGRGAAVEHLAPIQVGADEKLPTVAEYLDQTADAVVSWTWDADPVRLRQAVATVRDWVRAEHGDPALLPATPSPIRWSRYVLPD